MAQGTTALTAFNRGMVGVSVAQEQEDLSTSNKVYYCSLARFLVSSPLANTLQTRGYEFQAVLRESFKDKSLCMLGWYLNSSGLVGA